jgi:DNA-directed RNA polymerase specialized sigma24 family protein
VIVEHRSDGRTVVDTAALAAITARPAWLVRRHVPRDDTGRYDVQHGELLLAGLPDPELVTAAEAARRTGVPAATIRSWAHRGRLASFDQRGDQPLYDLADIRTLTT